MFLQVRMQRGKSISITLPLAAAFFLTCYLTQTIDCVRLRKTERREGRKEVNVGESVGLQEGKIVFGRVFEKGSGLESQVTDGPEKASNTTVEDEATYQADSPVLPNPSYQHAMKHMVPSLTCAEDHLKFKVLGPGSSKFAVDQKSGSPMPLSLVPSSCGYRMHRNSFALIMVVPYDGCNVIQEGGSYVFPLSWHGMPVSLWCPMTPTPAPTTPTTSTAAPQDPVSQTLKYPPPQVPQLPPQVPQLPPQVPQVPQLPPKVPQLPPQVPQVPPQVPQFPPQMPQFPPQMPQFPPQMPQLPPQLPPQVPQLPPQVPPQMPQLPHMPPSKDTGASNPQIPQRPVFPPGFQYPFLYPPGMLSEPPKNPGMPKFPQMSPFNSFSPWVWYYSPPQGMTTVPATTTKATPTTAPSKSPVYNPFQHQPWFFQMHPPPYYSPSYPYYSPSKSATTAATTAAQKTTPPPSDGQQIPFYGPFHVPFSSPDFHKFPFQYPFQR